MQHFNPDWSDFIRVDEVLDIPLHLPKTLARKQESSIWVDCKKTITDTWAQEEIMSFYASIWNGEKHK